MLTPTTDDAADSARLRASLRDWRWPALLALVFAAAAFLRFYRLDALPLGFHYDEGLDAVSAREIWSRGVHPIFFPQSGSREPLMIYLESLGILLLGATRLGARIAQACVGTASVVAAWFLFRDLLGRRAGLLATAFMAVSFWHTFESRVGLRAISQPLIETLCLLFLWRTLTRRRWPDAVLAGAFLGLSLYTYTAARALPVLTIVLVLWQALASPGFVRKQWGQVLAAAGASLAVFAPLGWYALHHPQEFLGRSLQVSVINPQPFTGSAEAGGVGASVLRTLGMFSVRGDPAWKYNLGGQPVFDWPVSALFYGGLLLAVLASVAYLRLPRRERPLASPHAFLLLTVVVMLLPGFLSSEAPHFLRTIGIIPAVFAFPALALAWLLAQGQRAGWRFLLPVTVLLLAAEGAETGYRYFVQWAGSPQAFYGMQADTAGLASYLEGLHGSQPVLFSSEYPGDPALLYLAPDEFSRIRWFNGRESLAFPPAGQSSLYVFTASYQPGFADLSRLFRPDQLVKEGRDPSGAVAYRVYRATAPPPLAPGHALRADLGGLAQLDGFSTAGAVGAGQTLDVQEYWHALKAGPTGLRAFLHLVDAQGHLWAQADGLGFYAEDWQPGDTAVNDQRLAVPAYAPPIPMKLVFGLYDPSTGQRQPIRSPAGQSLGDEITLGSVSIQAAPQPAAAWQPPHSLDRQLAPGLSLIGYDLPANDVRAGGTLPVDLFWRVSAPPAAVPAVRLVVSGRAGAGAANGPAGRDVSPDPSAGSAGAGAGPGGAGSAVVDSGLTQLLAAPSWPLGVIEDRHQVTVPPTARAGQASVEVGGVSLGQVTVTEPAREYTLPPVQHRLDVPVGAFARLAGYDLSPGPELGVTLVWQSTAITPTSYKVFVHVLDGANQVVAQHDGVPRAGAMPTTLWLPGQVIADHYAVPLPAGLPAGARLEIGLYEPVSGKRVDLGGQDHLILPLP